MLTIANAGIPITSASALEGGQVYNGCNCVVFRLDDVQDFWLIDQQVAIMDLFVSHNSTLALGLIMDDFGDDKVLLEQIKRGTDKGLLELALHGWQHLDHSTLDTSTQVRHFSQANDKLKTMTGAKFDVFIAPYNKFNADTIKAMEITGIRILSGDKDDPYPIFVSGTNKLGTTDANATVLHLPATISYKYIADSIFWKSVSVDELLSAIDEDIEQYGYAGVTLHPQDLAYQDNGGSITSDFNEAEFEKLELLLTSLISKGIPAKSFSDVVRLEHRSYDLGNYMISKTFRDNEIIIISMAIGAVIATTLILIDRRVKNAYLDY